MKGPEVMHYNNRNCLRCIFIFIFCIVVIRVSAQDPRLVIPTGHSQIVRDVEFDASGKRLLTWSYDSTVRVWDARTGSELIELSGTERGLSLPAFSKDGKKILTGSGHRTAMIWSAETGKLLVTTRPHFSKLTSVSYSPDNKRIATASEDGDVKVWDASDGKLLFDLYGHYREINEVSFSPDSKLVVTACYDGVAKLWNAIDGSLVHTLKGHKENVTFARFTNDSKRLLTSSWDSTVKVWDVKTGKFLFQIDGINDIRAAEFSPDNKIIATGLYNNRVDTWDASTGQHLRSFVGHTSSVWTVRFSRNGKYLLTSGNRDNARLWEVATGMQLRNYSTNSLNVNEAVFSPDESRVALAVYENKAVIFNRSGEQLVELKGHSKKVVFSAASPDQEKIIVGLDDNTAKVWNRKTGKLIYTIADHYGSLNTACFSPDGKFLVTGSSDKTAKIRDAATGKARAHLQGHSSGISMIAFSADGQKIATASYDYSVRIWNTATGDSTWTYTHRDYVNSIAFSPEGNYLLTSSGDLSLQQAHAGYAVLWDLRTPKFLRFFNRNNHAVIASLFSPDGKRVLTVSSNGSSSVWDTESGNHLFDLDVQSDERYSAGFSPDEKTILIAYNDQSAMVFDFSERKMRKEIKGFNHNLFPASFSADGKTIAIASETGKGYLFDASNGKLIASSKQALTHDYLVAPTSLMVWEPANGNTQRTELNPGSDYGYALWNENRIVILDGSKLSLYNISARKKNNDLIALDSSDYIVHLPGKQYMATPKATKLLSYVTHDLKVISFEQLDVKFNRPDIVLNALGNEDSTMINAYRKAYQKRVKKLGLDTAVFNNALSVPEADFVNRNEINYEQRAGKLKLRIRATERSFHLNRFNLWVNESPLFGMKGISLARWKRNSFDTTIVINLSYGLNSIETSVTNSNGAESFRAPLKVNYIPSQVLKPRLFFIGIGIDKFADSRHNLNYSVKDVRDLALKLKLKYPEMLLDTLFNESITYQNVARLKKKLQATGVNDKVIITYSGHGLLSKDFDYYLSTYNVDFYNPEKGGLSYDLLESLLDSIPARQKLMLIDACHSGEVDKEEMLHYRQVMNNNPNPGLKGGELENMDSTAKLGMKNSFELMQELFVNVGRSTGATIISAAAGTQLAQERGDLRNGVFTYSILEFMEQNPSATVTELKNYVNRRVPELTNGLQVPTTRTETKLVDWRVW